jgi:hypothetical protein
MGECRKIRGGRAGGPFKPGVGLSGAVRSGSPTIRWMCTHHDISIDAEAEAAAHGLNRALKDSSSRVGCKEGLAVITTEG